MLEKAVPSVQALQSRSRQATKQAPGTPLKVFGKVAAVLSRTHSENLGRGDADSGGTDGGDGGS
jgi:hypothetical protein